VGVGIDGMLSRMRFSPNGAVIEWRSTSIALDANTWRYISEPPVRQSVGSVRIATDLCQTMKWLRPRMRRGVHEQSEP